MFLIVGYLLFLPYCLTARILGFHWLSENDIALLLLKEQAPQQHPRGPGSIPGMGTTVFLSLRMPLWRNWIARPPSKRKVVGSIPTRGASGLFVQKRPWVPCFP